MRYLCVIVLVLIWSSCDPVKQIQRNDAQMAKMERVMLDRGLCRPDTFVVIKRDTTMRVDTVGEIYIYTDTVIDMDTVRITRERIRDVLRTITIRDTVLRQIVDEIALKACRIDRQRAEDALADSKQIARHRGAIIALLSALLLLMLFFALSK